MTMKTIEIKLNQDLGNYKKNQIIRCEIDNTGIIKNNYWRKRLRDSQTDNCCEIIKKNKMTRKKPLQNSLED